MNLPRILLLGVALVATLVGGYNGRTRTCAADLQDGDTVKTVLRHDHLGTNLLADDGWRPWGKGYERVSDGFVCDNGQEDRPQRGVSQTVLLNQTRPEPFVATAWSKAEAVSGGADSNYSLYLDLVYQDGTPLWGQVARFAPGTHDWEQKQVTVFPEKPVRQVSFHLLLRSHAGKAWFRNPTLRTVQVGNGACLFEGVPVRKSSTKCEGFQVRDVAAGSDFVKIEHQALQLQLSCVTNSRRGATFYDVTLQDTSRQDRAITLLYAIPIDVAEPATTTWLHDPRHRLSVESGREYSNTSPFDVGVTGQLSRYPLGAVAAGTDGTALAIDMSQPAFYRIVYHHSTGELYLAYDLALTAERPTAKVRFCRYGFKSEWGFRAALARYYELFPQAFVCRTPSQGLWMPFAKISDVQGWEDFGFRFKEGTNEVAWDDQHEIITFRYTEPMTWWMRMSPELPRTLEAAASQAERLAKEQNDRRARALLSSGFHTADGNLTARLLDTPWCNGAVWSINSMPAISGEVTDFKNKWNSEVRERWYGTSNSFTLDGEYIDSSEGYVTELLDFRRDHFAASPTPLVFSQTVHQPAIFRGLVAQAYARAIADDIHAEGKLMMANSTPIRLCWLAPLLDVMGTETNWHPGQWRPMSDADLLYRRAMCKGKPFCFLMNTRFEEFSHELVERYMKRALAYGMFPGFFSHNASEGHYFTRPELYNRDRSLFKKYVPLCRRVAEAGWEPITLAQSSDENIHVERFGDRLLTVFNDSDQPRAACITWEGTSPRAGRELLSGDNISWTEGTTTISLGPEDVAVLTWED